MTDMYAYSAPDEFRPKAAMDLVKLASRPYMGLTAFVASRPHLVIGFDGSEYTLEDTEGELIQLANFDWDVDNFSEENALIAASRVEGSPLEPGVEVDGQLMGKLAYDEESGEWSVTDGTGGSVELLNLIETLEAAGWEVEEQPLEFKIERAASAACTECTNENCDSPSCPCPCHDTHEAKEAGEQDEEFWNQDGTSKETVPNDMENDNSQGSSYSGSCENCGHPYENHLIGGTRCPSGAPPPSGREDQERMENNARLASFDKTTDTNGDPLRAGDFYEMHSKEYKIPDTIKIIQIAPDLLVATTHEGAVTLKLKPEDIESQGYSFEPLFPSENPNKRINAHFTPAEVELMEKTSRKKFSPSEQQTLIDEPGVARNKAKLRLDDSHYAQSDDEIEDDGLDLYFF